MEPIREPAKIAEIKEILQRNNYRDYFLFTLGINSGLRISDLLKLKVKDVRGKTYLMLKETKTKKDRKMKITYQTMELVNDYIKGMDDEEYLFQSRNGKNRPLTRQRAYSILKEVSEKVGLEEIGCHTLRKTFGYHFYQMNKDVVLLQQIFNHSHPDVTLRYIGINQDIQDKALEGFFL